MDRKNQIEELVLRDFERLLDGILLVDTVIARPRRGALDVRHNLSLGYDVEFTVDKDYKNELLRWEYDPDRGDFIRPFYSCKPCAPLQKSVVAFDFFWLAGQAYDLAYTPLYKVSFRLKCTDKGTNPVLYLLDHM